MASRGPGGGGGRKVLLPPINCIFSMLQKHATVSVWLYEQLGVRIEGKIRGFDEFMNLTIDEAVEVKQPTKADPEPENARRELGEYIPARDDGSGMGGWWERIVLICCVWGIGQILLKGDNVCLIQEVM